MGEDRSPGRIGLNHYDAADRPFDFTTTGTQTALICEADDEVQRKISEALTKLGFKLTVPIDAQEAIKKMRFHVYDLVVIDESFAGADPDHNEILAYLENLPMSTRRRIFVALLSGRFRTSDNLAALNKSVNIIINYKNLEEIEAILRAGIDEHNSFYHVFRETMVKLGRI